MGEDRSAAADANIKKTPIDTYDFFAYVIPGMIVTGAMLFWQSYLHGVTGKWLYENVLQNSVQIYLSTVVAFIVVSYVFGHAVATLSAILFDRFLISRIFGYPHLAILFPGHNTGNSTSARFYKGILASIYTIILLYILRTFLPTFLGYNLWMYGVCYFLIMSISHAVVMYLKKIRCNLHLPLGRFAGAFCSPFSMLFELFEGMLKKWFGWRRALSKNTRDKFFEKFEKLYYKPTPDDGSDIYWLCSLYIDERSGTIKSTIYKWLVLYGMLRNMSMSLLLSSIFCSVPLAAIGQDHKLVIVSIVFYVMSVFSLVRYYYIYDNYYSKAIFRGFVAVA